MRLRRPALLAALLPSLLSAQPSPRAALSARLDSIARAELAGGIPGLSVAVLRGRDTLLLAGYGVADLGLGAPVTTATTFRLSGPATVMLGAALLQQVEAGRLRVDDDAARLLPEFPWQGRHVTVRQLMDATSGLPDFHYLGDALFARRAVPKSPDEVTALFAGLPFAHEPGARWQWTVSGFHLAGGLVERLSGMPYADYLRQRILAPAGLTHTYYCDDVEVTPGLARAYVPTASGYRNPPIESATTYPYHASVCATAGDVASFARALRDGRLITPASWRTMTTAEGAAAARLVPNDSTYTRGFGVRMNREDGHRWVGEYGALMSYGTALLDFPDDSLTVAALANVGQGAVVTVARQLARAALGLAPLPAPTRRPAATASATAPTTPAAPTPLAPALLARYLGTYVTRAVDTVGPDARYQRTFRVFDQNGRLTVQPLGEPASPLVPVSDDVFTLASNPVVRFVFAVENGRATALTVRGPTNAGSTGRRVIASQ